MITSDVGQHVLGNLCNPNGMLLNLLRPWCDVKAVLLFSASSGFTW